MSSRFFDDEYRAVQELTRRIAESFITEVPDGIMDNVNKTYKTSQRMYVQSLLVIVNGSIRFDYSTADSSTIVMNTVLDSADIIKVRYIPVTQNR